jgi:hypothetical protein
MTDEIWKPIPGFDGYEVSNNGRVRSYFKHAGRHWDKLETPQRILSAKPARKGYRQVRIRGTDGKYYLRLIHQLVMLAFRGPRPDGLEVCHGDGNKLNNWLWNLRHGTHASNRQDYADAKELGLDGW